MSDAEVASLAVRLQIRRVRGKQPKPEAYIQLPLPSVNLGEVVSSHVPPPYKGTGGTYLFQELYYQYGCDDLTLRKVDRNNMRFMIRSSFLLHHRNYCESFLTSKRCPDSIKGSSRGLGSRLSLCADRLISEMNRLQRTELFRKMIIRCQEQKLHEALLDILAFSFPT
jgi:hypothetical protein